MSFIIRIREKSWIIYSFILFALAIFIFGLLAGIYQTSSNKEKYVGKIGPTKISRQEYVQLRDQLQAQEPDPVKLHEKTWEKLVTQTFAENICTDTGIFISDERVRKEIASYSKNVQTFMETYYKLVYDSIQEEKITFDQFCEDLKKQRNRSFFAIHGKEVKKMIKIAEVGKLMLANQDTYKPSKTSLAIVYGALPYSQLEKTDESNYTQSDKEKAFQQKAQETPKEFRRITYTIVATSPIEEHIQEAKEELEAQRENFKKTKDIVRFINRHYDDDDKKETLKTWEKDQAPYVIQQLEKDQVSPVMRAAKNKFAIYRIESVEPNQIVAWQIVKKVATEPESAWKARAKRIADLFGKVIARDRNKTTKQALEKYAKIYEDNINKNMANKIGSSNYADQIAHHVYQKNLLPLVTFFFKPKKDANYYLVGYAGYINNKDQPKNVEKDITKHLKQKKELQHLQQFLDQSMQSKDVEKAQQTFKEKYGYIEFRTATVDVDMQKINTINCSGEIPKILAQNKTAHTFLNQSEKEAIVIFVKQKNENNQDINFETTAQTINHVKNTQDYFQQYRDTKNIQDNRYKIEAL